MLLSGGFPESNVKSPARSGCHRWQPCQRVLVAVPGVGTGWDKGGTGNRSVPSWLCFTALLGAGMEFGWGWAFPGSDSPGQDLAPMTVLRGE